MTRLCIFFLIFFAFNEHGAFAQNQPLRISTTFASNSNHYLGLQNGLRSNNKSALKFNLNHDRKKSQLQLTLNYDGYSKFTLDSSYLEYISGIATYGFGAIDRNWSLSKNTSLILSHNARPSKSIYLKLKNRFGYNWLPSEANWSFETFNGLTEGSLNSTKSMLLGARAIISPVKGLDFELVQTSQWGGKGYKTGLSALGAALFTDTNDKSNANINKMAGFGISYLIPSNVVPLRIYGQTIGEDEAGKLPSCYTYMIGLELLNNKINYPTTIGIEALDTRIDTTENGNCGPNTMYNNSTYDYTNYGLAMGTAIDTEGTSIEVFGLSEVSDKINFKYSTKYLTINDANWSGHRLSSKRETGWLNSLGATWNTNNYRLNFSLYHQDFTLDKVRIKNSYGFSFSSSVIF
jgi:hypothetical protein